MQLLNEPNQELSFDATNADGEILYFDLSLRTFSDGNLCANISVNGDLKRAGVICKNEMPLLVDNRYKGNLYFQDVYGDEEPTYSGFNDTVLLIWDTEYKIG